VHVEKPALRSRMNGRFCFVDGGGHSVLCQVRMQKWTKGRLALIGDAGYCPSPAAGMGGSVAILGAAALADALRNTLTISTELLRSTTNRTSRDIWDQAQLLLWLGSTPSITLHPPRKSRQVRSKGSVRMVRQTPLTIIDGHDVEKHDSDRHEPRDNDPRGRGRGAGCLELRSP
jgi:hypothetical protein